MSKCLSKSRLSPKTLMASVLAAGCLAAPAALRAQTATETLVNAYIDNPRLQGQREAVRATDQTVARAIGGWRPVVSIVGDTGRAVHETSTPVAGGSITTTEHLSPQQIGLQASLPLYDGGRTFAEVRRTKKQVLRQREVLRSTEAAILSEAAKAHMAVLRDQEIVAHNQANVAALARQVAAARTRAQVRDVTQTDVALAEARHAGGLTQLAQAEAALQAALSNYLQVVGLQPVDIKPFSLPLPVPDTLAAALPLVMDNPDVRAAAYAVEAADEDVDSAASGLRPNVSLRAGIRRLDEQDRVGEETEVRDVVLQLSMPLYEGGITAATVRQAKHVSQQLRHDYHNTVRQVTDQIKRSWEAYTASITRIRSSRVQVQAAELAVAGASEELRAGTRTVIDVLDTERELFEARISLARAVYEEAAARLDILQAIGQLSVGSLGLPVEAYDPVAHYERAAGRWFGTDIDTVAPAEGPAK